MYYSAIDDHLFTEKPRNFRLSDEIMSSKNRISPVQSIDLYRTNNDWPATFTANSSFKEKYAAPKSGFANP